MTGYMIYEKNDAQKNKMYVEMHKEAFADFGVDIKLVLTDKIYKEHKMELGKPDFVINRSRDYIISKEYEKIGIRVFNSSEVTRIANNKGLTYKFLKGKVPFMPTEYEKLMLISGVNVNNNLISYPYVLKSCSGHGGSQVFMINSNDDEEIAIKKIENDKFVKQQCCTDLGKDVRAYIIGKKVVAAVLRTSEKSFKSNYSLGGNVSLYDLNETERKYVDTITQILPMDFAAIDFIFNNGQAAFNEIEDAAGARMLYSISDIDIVKMQVEYMMKELKKSCIAKN